MKLNDVFKKVRVEDLCEWSSYQGVEFLVAPMGNQKQREHTMELFTLAEAVEMDRLGPLAFGGLKAKEAVGKMYRLYADTLVFGTRGVEDDEGNPIQLTNDQVYQYMMEYDEFANWLINTAQGIADRRETKKAEVKKK